MTENRQIEKEKKRKIEKIGKIEKLTRRKIVKYKYWTIDMQKYRTKLEK